MDFPLSPLEMALSSGMLKERLTIPIGLTVHRHCLTEVMKGETAMRARRNCYDNAAWESFFEALSTTVALDFSGETSYIRRFSFSTFCPRWRR